MENILKSNSGYLAIAMLLGVVLIAGCIGQSQKCTTEDCFVKAANACSSATYTTNASFGTMSFESASNCTYTKTIVNFSSDTPTLKALLDGKSMTCTYDNGAFDANWTKYLVLGAESCDGQLKDTLADLLPIYVSTIIGNSTDQNLTNATVSPQPVVNTTGTGGVPNPRPQIQVQ